MQVSILIDISCILSRPKIYTPNHEVLVMTSTIDKFLNEPVEVKLIEDIVTDQYKEVEKLFQARVKVNDKNALGATLPYWATCVGDLDCISTLLNLGADIGATALNGETPSILQPDAVKREL